MTIHRKSILISTSFTVENIFSKSILIVLISNENFWSAQKTGTLSLIFLREGFNLILYFALKYIFMWLLLKFRLRNFWNTSSRRRWLWGRVQVPFGLRQGNRADDASHTRCWSWSELHIPARSGKLKRGRAGPLSGDNRGGINSYHIQVLVWNPCRPRADDHSAVANHICESWHIICLQEGVGFANHATLHHRFHVVTVHHCALLLNKDTFERDVTTNSIMVPARKCTKGALEGIVVNDRFRRPVDGGCHHFSILNDHVNQKSAARRSEGRTSLVGDFSKGAQRGKLGESSPLQAAFSQAPVPWRSFGNSCLSAREHEVCRMLWHCQTAAHQSRVAHQEDGSHGCGCQEDGPILPPWLVGTHAARSL